MVHGCSGNSLLHQVKVNSLCVLTGAGCSVPEAGCHRDCVWGVGESEENIRDLFEQAQVGSQPKG